ncbi:NADH-quinone oxidoreductase subunit NuoN [Bacillus sp. FJAT-27986]|uniref:NADH-quinone oxidoreductase subunit NuoN n=1 Tax=Bacillus sp. FJAT-27986 TaxID=1743146 RepID=UPI00080AFD0B|nr:NADH-quinone oxidoreductase subunit NuoN [Bacillus sp. FJAT-27986]OCA88405.1 NADH-quinone oxidoreductase subunit N [Bacillus sp. FJAT-27986]
MDMETLLSMNWNLMIPEFIILGAAIILSILDLCMPKQFGRKVLGWFAFGSIGLAIISLIGLFPLEAGSILYDTFRLDAFAKAFKLILLIGSAFVMVLAVVHKPRAGMQPYQAEFYYLLLTALLGAMIMTSSGDLITLFVGLELLSVSSYILAGMQKNNRKSAEASMKYVVNGGISTAIILFALSYMYGVSGTTNIFEIGTIFATQENSQLQYIAGLSFFIFVIGISFKLATVPFHMWAPDVYEGSPTPVTAFLSIVSKAAGFALLLRIVVTVFLTATMDDIGFLSIFTANQNYLAVLASITMIAGNLIALRQKNLKRMLAYSSIAHAGYLLAAVTAFGEYTIESIWYYFAAYILMMTGAFAVIQFIAEDRKIGDEDQYMMAGLYKKSPFLAVSMCIFILSMAGIPGTAGFIAKLNIFMNLFAKEQGHYILAAIMLVTTVISYIYYFNIIVHLFMRTEEETKGKMKISVIHYVIGICAVGLILFGLFPHYLLDFFHQNFTDIYQMLK